MRRLEKWLPKNELDLKRNTGIDRQFAGEKIETLKQDMIRLIVDTIFSCLRDRIVHIKGLVRSCEFSKKLNGTLEITTDITDSKKSR